MRHESRDVNEDVITGNRRRSSSDPLRTFNATHDSLGVPRRKPLPETYMPDVPEEPSRTPPGEASQRPTLGVPVETGGGGYGRRLSNAMGMSRFPSFRPSSSIVEPTEEEQYEEDLVDVLDTVGMWWCAGKVQS